MKPADLLVIDGRHLLWRCVHAYGDLGIELPDEDWLDTGAMFGFLLLAKKAHKRYKGRVVVAWEAASNFRVDLYPNYKGKLDQKAKFKEIREAQARGEEPEEIDAHTRTRFDLNESIQQQQEHLQVILKCIGVTQYMGTKCEADDVMATLAAAAKRREWQAVIYTGDSDLLQCVEDMVAVVKPGKKGEDEIFQSDKDVTAKLGVPPRQVADFKALAGDTSDNIPGAKGVGKKAAEKLLVAYGTLDAVIDAAKSDDDDWPCSKKQKETIVASKDELYLWQSLTIVRASVRVTPRISPEADKKKLQKLFRKYKFSSFLKPSEVRGFLNMAKG